MPTEVSSAVATAASAPAGTPGLGSSLAGLGTAVKVFVLAHPVSLAVVGGALLGAGLYHVVTRRGATHAAADAAPAAEAAPTAA
jgi:hypothetical protein